MTKDTARVSRMKMMRKVSFILLLLLLFTLAWLLCILILSKSSFSARIYDAIIVQMTKAWYATVFQQVQPHTVLLDVGIGTAGALLMNSDTIKSKQLIILGIDVNEPYVQAAQRSVAQHGLQDRVQIESLSIYNVPGIRKWIQQQTPNIETVDAVYFSGSFSLLPDPLGALESARQLLRPDAGAKVYITQTYASSNDSIMRYIKPLIRYITTIEFGQLVTERKALSVFDATANLKLEQHDKIKQDNAALRAFPPAYLSVLETVDGISDNQTCTAS